MKIAEAERDALKEKIARMDSRTDQVSEGMVKIEREIETGMEKVKEKAKEEITSEMKEIKEKSINIVLYGLEESKEEDAAKRRDDDMKKVMKMAEEIDVSMNGAVEIKFRAGRKDEDTGKPRPLIVKIEDDETREKILNNARKLSRKEEWKRVYISPDLTFKQREEARKDEHKVMSSKNTCRP